jgi:hypothetical protein
MTNREMDSMNGQLDATRLHIEELDREIETIRTERFLQAAAPDRPALPRRAKARIGRGLISLGVALGGEMHGRATGVTRTDARV